ncbi:MAG: histidinol-phosphate aminotransferase family protein [Phycisphaerales bacterium]|nr:histidinol-phosphate aminotransferase family protein [Phycisphaerales bacterium]
MRTTARPGATGLEPSPALNGMVAYHVPRPCAPIDLYLDGNEGEAPPAELLQRLTRQGPEVLRRYPSSAALEASLAAHYGLRPEQVVVTGGGDDALDRACRAMLGPGRAMVLPVPTFEMLERYGRLIHAELERVGWPDGPYPTAAVESVLTERTRLIAVVSPNNPTGAVIHAADLRRLSTVAPQALLLVDLAYVEFADEDLTATALALPNAVVVRTFSKAWGFAGVRIGYALGPAELIGWLRAAGNPYAAAGPSLALAADRLATGQSDLASFVARVRAERLELQALLRSWGARVPDSQANFVFARFGNALQIREALAVQGISVRVFPGRSGLENALRITCPGVPQVFARLRAALGRVFQEHATAFSPGDEDPPTAGGMV